MHVNPILVWLHVLLFVFWLGTDVGVFVCGVWARSAGRALSERLLLLQVLAFIDLWPRACAILMLPVGLLLARGWGAPVSAALLGGSMAAALAWAVLSVLSLRQPPGPHAGTIRRVTNLFLLVFGGGVIALGASWLLGGAVAHAPWIAWKLMIYGAICLAALGIDLAFTPVITGFGRLAANPADAGAEALIGPGIDRALRVVLVLYALLLAASLLGSLKPAAI
jgi:hypothetical protein